MSYRLKGEYVIIEGEKVLVVPGPLPSSPADGYIAIDETDGLFKVYNETKSKWIPLDDFYETPKGGVFKLSFYLDSIAFNNWLIYHSELTTSNETPAVLPFDAKFIGATYSNEDPGTDFDIEIYRAADGDGNSASLVETFSVSNARVARTTNVTKHQFYAGDKIAVFIRDQGTNPDEPVVDLWFRITDDKEEASVENYYGDF